MFASFECKMMNEVRAVKIMIVFYSRYGNTVKMAEEIAFGAKELELVTVTMRRIADDVPMDVVAQNPAWSKIAEDLNNRIPTTPIEDILPELPQHDAIIIGSPTRFGNMAAPMKALWDITTDLWIKGSLIGKVGGVFTSASSVHGGQETTAVSMMFPMLHHGMIIVGVPYSVPELTHSGSPYGPSSIVGPLSNKKIEKADIQVARVFGKRIVEVTRKLV
jgi:NAD(P)H dehydrogenase (quinone)